MKTISLKEYPEYLALIRKVANYRKHNAIIHEADSFTNNGSFWDCGSRSSHYIVTGNVVKPVPGPTAPPQFGGGGSVTIPLNKGQYVVSIGTFRGKAATATITIGTGE